MVKVMSSKLVLYEGDFDSALCPRCTSVIQVQRSKSHPKTFSPTYAIPCDLHRNCVTDSANCPQYERPAPLTSWISYKWLLTFSQLWPNMIGVDYLKIKPQTHTWGHMTQPRLHQTHVWNHSCRKISLSNRIPIEVFGGGGTYQWLRYKYEWLPFAVCFQVMLSYDQRDETSISNIYLIINLCYHSEMREQWEHKGSATNGSSDSNSRPTPRFYNHPASSSFRTASI